MPKLIIGCGYVGHRLARFWAKKGEKVFVTSRSQLRANAFEQQGFGTCVFDVTNTEQVTLPEVESIVFAVGFDRSADKSLEDVYVNGLRNVLNITPSTARKFIYLSSTGVYGQTDGEWIDEESPCKPNRPGGKACLEAERLLQLHPTIRSRTIVLRLAGIYGPERLPHVAKLRSSEPLQVAADSYLNLIHVDDVVQVIVAADQHVNSPTMLCVSDGQPVIRRDFYLHLTELLGVPAPTFEPPPLRSNQAARAQGNKRIRNERLMSNLQIKLRFPSYREGLAAFSQNL